MRILRVASVALMFLGTPAIALFAEDKAPETKPSPSSPDDPLAEAKKLIEAENWEEAAHKFREFFEKHPKDPKAVEARFWAGYCLVQSAEYEAAEEVLQPFEGELANDTWADDALLHLGRAYRAQDKRDEALHAWKRGLEKHPDSVWRTQVNLEVIDVLFQELHDIPGCLAACEQVVKDVDDRSTTTEARYLGAYCLNALRRFDEASKWADQQFDPESPLEEAWRRLLGVQRDLLQGHADEALATLSKLDADFPDLDNSDRSDLLTRACRMLRLNDRSGRARELMLAELRQPTVRSEDEVGTLLDELSTIYGEVHRPDYLAALGDLAGKQEIPFMVRTVALERRVDGFREDELIDRAETALRDALAKESAEFIKTRASLLLAEILADEHDDAKGAAKLLEELQAKLSRRDLIHQVQDALEGYRIAEEAS